MIPEAPSPLPQTLGEFTIDGLLGEGGSSLVYAARRGAELLALKVLHPDLGLSERERERFLAEAEMLHSIRHPAIVELRSSGVLPDGRPFIAMPRLEGRSLASRLNQGPIPIAKALSLFDGVAEAVAALHRTGLIHRDIKPENVLWLDREDRLVLLDLGIARDAEGAPSTTTRAGLARGTPRYMAPERLFGQRASVRTDVYELALLLYVMMAGSAPWKDDDPQGRLNPEIAPHLAHALPDGLKGLVLDSLALDPNRRPASVDELVARLRDAARALPPPEPNRLELVSSSTMVSGPIVVTPYAGVSRESSFGRAPTELHPTNELGLAPTELHATPRAVSLEARAEQHPTLRSASQRPGAASGGRFAVVALLVGLTALAAGATFLFVSKSRAAKSAVHTKATSTPTASDDESSAPLRPSAAPSPETDGDDEKPRPVPTASSSARRPSPQPVPTASASSVASQPTSAPTSAGSATAGQAPMPPSCSGLIALFCSPGSAGTPEECAAWKGNVASWRTKYPPDVLEETCSSALSASKSGLAARKTTKIPR